MRGRHSVRIVAAAATGGLLVACLASPPTAPDAEALPAPAEVGPVTGTRSGQLVGISGHQARGTARLIVRDTVGVVEFSADFVVDAVPGPFVYVNTTADANTGRPLRVSALRANSGAQSYAFRVPAGATFSHVLVWCDPFNVGVGAAPLGS